MDIETLAAVTQQWMAGHIGAALAWVGMQDNALIRALQAQTDLKEWLLVLLGPVFTALVLIEAWHFRKTSIYSFRDSLASASLGTIYIATDVVIIALLVMPLAESLYQYRFFTIAIDGWSFVALYVLVEFCFYWYHRCSHRVRYFWCTHGVHHASQHMNFSTAARQSWIYTLSGNSLFFMPLVLLGFAPHWVIFALLLNLGYQFVIHTQWIGKLHPALEFIFNTPSHHRAHHGRNPEYIDKNFGGTLIIFDRMFGTFVLEQADTNPVDYGTVNQVHSYSAVRLTLFEWTELARDMAQPGPLWLRLKHLWAPPEWTRDVALAGNTKMETI